MEKNKKDIAEFRIKLLLRRNKTWLHRVFSRVKRTCDTSVICRVTSSFQIKSSLVGGVSKIPNRWQLIYAHIVLDRKGTNDQDSVNLNFRNFIRTKSHTCLKFSCSLIACRFQTSLPVLLSRASSLVTSHDGKAKRTCLFIFQFPPL